MSIASRICEYLQHHGKATRPQLSHDLEINEKSVETAIRKLLRGGFLCDTGALLPNPHGRKSPVYALGDRQFTQAAFTTGPVPVGRPRKEVCEEYSFRELGSAMNALFAVRVA